MPNTLAHVGAQTLATRSLIQNADPKWIYLGCVIPDLPWILQKIVQFAGLAVDPYLLRAYLIAQASLLSSLVLCGAIAMLARHFWQIFALLSGNVVLHLILDAMQTKWANGVHFWAPLSWELTNWGLFWPEHAMTYVLTGLGLIVAIWYWRNARERDPGIDVKNGWRLAGALSLTLVYFALPAVLIHGPVGADNHYLDTLRHAEDRVGAYVECDRASLRRSEGETVLQCWDGKPRTVEGVDDVDAPAKVSVRGEVAQGGGVVVTDRHVHLRGVRDAASYVGLALVAGVWIVAWTRTRRVRMNRG